MLNCIIFLYSLHLCSNMVWRRIKLMLIKIKIKIICFPQSPSGSNIQLLQTSVMTDLDLRVQILLQRTRSGNMFVDSFIHPLVLLSCSKLNIYRIYLIYFSCGPYETPIKDSWCTPPLKTTQWTQFNNVCYSLRVRGLQLCEQYNAMREERERIQLCKLLDSVWQYLLKTEGGVLRGDERKSKRTQGKGRENGAKEK